MFVADWNWGIQEKTQETLTVVEDMAASCLIRIHFISIQLYFCKCTKIQSKCYNHKGMRLCLQNHSLIIVERKCRLCGLMHKIHLICNPNYFTVWILSHFLQNYVAKLSWIPKRKQKNIYGPFLLILWIIGWIQIITCSAGFTKIKIIVQ